MIGICMNYRQSSKAMIGDELRFTENKAFLHALKSHFKILGTGLSSGLSVHVIVISQY